MQSRYSRELAALPKTYEVCLSWSVAPLARLIERFAGGPLTIVGSGGSFSGAVFAATLHEHYTRQLAKAVTPLHVTASDAQVAGGLLCLSASGRNRDIRAAFVTAAQAEIDPLGAFILSIGTPLKALQSRFAYIDVIEAALDIEPDGFLAVNSLLATCVLLTRAYREIAGDRTPLPDRYASLISHSDALHSLARERGDWVTELTGRTTSLVYSPPLAAAAADLESRFVEGALGNLHSADWRNFGHGRHHWLAKRAETTIVIAMVSSSDRTLAERTLNLLPNNVPTRSAYFEGREDEQALLALLFALHLADAAGEAAGIDPGKPGVPEFGRKLYHLGLKCRRPTHRWAALRRKARARGESVGPQHEQAYDLIVEHIRAARPRGVVFDYDGTLCDRRARFDSLPPEMAACLVRLAETGAPIGIATGRGRSAGRALQEVFPSELRGGVVIGYYNGSLILNIDQLPAEADFAPVPEAAAIAERIIGRWPRLRVEARRWQVAIDLPDGNPAERWVGPISELVWDVEPGARTLCSAHSVDVVLNGFGKNRVVDEIHRLAGAPSAPILRIGDKGSWPGNDVDLLADPLGLSVDEVSQDLATCWNLAPAGIRGPQATMYYLSRLAEVGTSTLALTF